MSAQNIYSKIKAKQMFAKTTKGMVSVEVREEDFGGVIISIAITDELILIDSGYIEKNVYT